MGARYANQVIVISSEIERGMDGLRASGCVRIPNGVGQPGRPPATNFLSNIGVEPGKYVLSVGRFVEDKGFHDLVEAFAAVKPAGVRLVLVGGSHRPTRYSRRLEALAANHDVVLTGLLSGDVLWEVFSQARLFVLPSYYEGLPITLLEAMSFGIDVVVSDIKANLELGLPPTDYFPVGNVEALGAMLLAKLSANRVRDFDQILEAGYRWPSIATQTLAVYQAVAAKT